MDFNYFYHRQQVSLIRAGAAACEEARHAHQWLADAYGRLISFERGRRVRSAARCAGGLGR